jgi:hypothetical protein
MMILTDRPFSFEIRRDDLTADPVNASLMRA